jgi:hypothetical protein
MADGLSRAPGRQWCHADLVPDRKQSNIIQDRKLPLEVLAFATALSCFLDSASHSSQLNDPCHSTHLQSSTFTISGPAKSTHNKYKKRIPISHGRTATSEVRFRSLLIKFRICLKCRLNCSELDASFSKLHGRRPSLPRQTAVSTPCKPGLLNQRRVRHVI